MQIRQDGLDKVIAEILEGKQRIISYPGTSQYQGVSGSSRLGVSACGLAALNCARIVFQLCEGPGVSPDGRENDTRSLLDAVLCRQTAEEIISICASWPSNDHLEVDELLKLPLFKHCFDNVKVHYALTEQANFLVLLRDMSAMNNIPVAAVITRTPEIVVCLKIPSTFNAGEIFIVFDSHPRPFHPSGSGFIVSLSMEEAAVYLYGLLALDAKILADPGMRWQAQLFSQFSSHLIVPKSTTSAPSESVADILMDASVMILQLNADISHSKQRETSLMVENHDLKAQIAQIQWTQEAKAMDIKGKKPSRGAQISGVVSSPSNHGRHPLVLKSSKSPSSSQSYAASGAQDEDNLPESTTDFITQLQIQYSEEDRKLTAERTALLETVTATFECNICFDEMQVDHIAQLTPCTHSFCRDCLRNHVTSTIGQHRYPVLCPACTADNALKPTNLDENIFEILGLSNETLELIQSLQLAPHSIVLHCRKCKETMFVDRKDHQEQSTITCPLRRCNYSWCKSCEQQIDIGGPQHSCDGSSELKHLMKRRGWRHCPGCQTPFLKETGCNHMTCLAPGCNTHFCYICGDMMTQSVVRSEIRAAISAHFRGCQLFEDVPDPIA